MAINFSQVKSLTIPEGDVKSISVGGVVVWQKSTKLYRQLEYIDMSGKYYNSFNRPAQGFYFMNVKFDTDNPVNTSLGTYGIYLGSAGSSNRRLWIGGNSNQVFQRLKGNAETSMANWSTLNSDTTYQIRLRTYSTNNTSGTFWYALNNLDTDTQVYGQYYNSTTYAMNLAELPYFYINAYSYNSSGTSATPQNLTVKGALNFKLYRFFVKENADSSEIKWDFIPVQRKSDGRVGLYNLKTGSFSNIQYADGSYVNTRTEPIADENPEWSPDA